MRRAVNDFCVCADNQAVAANGGCVSLVRNMELGGAGPECLAALVSMGHISGMKAHIAKQLLDADAATQLKAALQQQEPSLKGAAAWTIEQIANQGEVTSKMLANSGVLVVLGPAYKISPGKAPQSDLNP